MVGGRVSRRRLTAAPGFWEGAFIVFGNDKKNISIPGKRQFFRDFLYCFLVNTAQLSELPFVWNIPKYVDLQKNLFFSGIYDRIYE